jgi:hypothetical protein
MSLAESELGGGSPPRLKLELDDDGLPGDENDIPLAEPLEVDESLGLDKLLELAGAPKADSALLFALDPASQLGELGADVFGSLPLATAGSPLKLSARLPE